jgi:hypothetical protein
MENVMPRKTPTPQQEKFIEAMADPNTKNPTEAARKAGCPAKNARITASRWLTKANISEEIRERKERALAHHRLTPEEVLGSAAFQMRSSMADVLDDDGSFSIEKARATGAVDLIKRHKETIRTINHKDGSTETVKTVLIELLTNQDGRKEVADYIGFSQNKTLIVDLRDKRLDNIKQAVETRAKEKGISYREELKNYLDNYASPEMKERLEGELKES